MAERACAALLGVDWQRTYLLVKAGEGCVAALERQDGLRRRFEPCTFAGREGWQCLNVANAAGRALLERGAWAVIDAESGIPLIPCVDVLEHVEDFTRSFYYRKNTRLYAVRFFVPLQDAAEPQLNLDVVFFKVDAHPARDVSFPRFAKGLMSLFHRICSLLSRKDGSRVLFMSENNTRLSGNLAAIDARMKERGLSERYEVSYSFRNIFEGRPNLWEWVKVIALVARQDYIFVEDYVPIFAALSLSPKTKLIQVWHAGFGFKLVGFGRFGIEGSPNPFASCHRKYTYALVGNERLREVYSEVFGIERQALLATGMPRLDGFLDSEACDRACVGFARRFPLAEDRHVVLFAPTYRGLSQRDAHYDYGRIDFARLHAFCCETNSVVVFKMHRFVTDPVPIPAEFSQRLFDAGDCDINGLLYATDVLVTDYSSCFYDYLLLGRPIVFYAYDKSYYMATRGVHRRLEDVAPGEICETFEATLAALRRAVEGGAAAAEPSAMLLDRAADGKSGACDRVIDAVLLGERNDAVWAG